MTASLRRFALALFVAFRLVRSRRSPRLSAVTVISMAGVAFGVMALTVVLGVTTGFQGAFQARILGLYPHLVVLKRAGDFREWPRVMEDLEATPGVVAASPATYDDMMVAAGVHRAGSIIKGIHLPTVESVIGVGPLLKDGASLDGLSEVPRVEVEGDRVVVRDVVAGKWLTVVAGDGAPPRALADDRTPPDPGHARVAVLDLRGGDRPAAPVLERVGADGEDGDDGLLASSRPLGPTRPGGLAPAREVEAGSWRLDLTGEVLALEEGTLVTLALLPGPAGRPVRTRLLVEPGRVPLPERLARVRLVHLPGPDAAPADAGDAPGARSLVLAPPGEGPTSAPVAPGEFTGYLSVPGRLPGIVLGVELARRLHAEPGDEVTLVTPLRGVDNKMLGPWGMAPSSSHHRVVGVFESGFYEYDARLALVSLQAAQRFLNRGPVIRWLEVRVEDLLHMGDVKRRVAAALDPYDLETLVTQTEAFEGRVARYLAGDVSGVRLAAPDTFVGGLRNVVQLIDLAKYQEMDFGYRPRFRLIDWQEMNTNLLSALKLQKVVLTIFFLIIIVVGSFVVVGSQIMVVHEKTPDIAILKAMGATSGAVRAVFTLQGLVVAGVGTAVGLAAGLGLCGLLAWVDWRLDASIYLIDRLPVEIGTLDLLLVAGATALCTLAATQYSAGRAAAKTVVEGLRAVD